MPGEEVAAREVAVGDVVRLHDPQAQRVERVLVDDGQVILEMRPLGLAVADTVRVTLSAETVIDRLGTAED